MWTLSMKLTFAAFAFLLAAAAAACNTVEGVGKDTAAVGDAVSDASKDAQH
jgi:predicted small secreted protein